MNIIEELTSISKSLNRVQDYMRRLDSQLSIQDQKQQDLLHLIENENLDTNQRYRIIKELKEIRIERRKIKNDIEISRTFKEHQPKLITIENRQFLLAELNKTKKSLETTYKNRIYTEEEIKEILGV